jgi:signal transduction histidine kinase
VAETWLNGLFAQWSFAEVQGRTQDGGEMSVNRLWRAFWAKAGAVSVRLKILGIVVFSVLICTIAMVWYSQDRSSASLRDELGERGKAVATGMAISSGDLILTENQPGLYNLAMDIRASHEDVAYVFVLDGQGEVLAHTFEGDLPINLLGANVLDRYEAQSVKRIQMESEYLQDVAVLVSGGAAGVVHVGMSEDRINDVVASYLQNILIWMGLVLILSILVAYFLSMILIRPVSRMAEATRSMSAGTFDWKSPVWAKDEIGRLGDALDMVSREFSEKEDMRRHLMATIMLAQEEERKRIARELHDGTSQTLASLMIGLKVVEESETLEGAKERTSDMRELVGRALKEVHDLALELRPSVLDDVGLVAGLQRHIKEYIAKTAIHVDFHIGNVQGARLLPEIETTVYRVVQEALANVAKHAQALNVSVLLERRGSSLVVIVEDDGRGFNVSRVMKTAREDKRLGLFGMQERASLIGGTLTVESHPGGGTTIFFECPSEQREVSHEQDQDPSS